MIRKLISSVLVVVMLVSAIAVAGFSAETIKFSDVDANSETGKAIYKLVEAGIVHGNGDGTFAPNSFVTRAELCKMVNNVWKFTKPAQTGFTDVTPADWFYDHVLIGKEAGYINGFDDGTFRGNDNVTREQVCAIIYRVNKMTPVIDAPLVKDQISDWAIVYVMAILNKGIIPVEEGDKFRATEDMTRGEVALALAKFIPDKTPVIVNPGGSSSSSSGSSSGGSSGGSSGSSSSGSNKKDYTEVNKEIVKNLKAAKKELSDSSNYNKFTSGEKKIIDIVVDVLDDVIKKDDEFKITTASIASRYDDEILKAMNRFSEFSEEGQAAFISKLSSLDKDTFDFVCKFFGVDPDDYSDILDKITE